MRTNKLFKAIAVLIVVSTIFCSFASVASAKFDFSSIFSCFTDNEYSTETDIYSTETDIYPTPTDSSTDTDMDEADDCRSFFSRLFNKIADFFRTFFSKIGLS